jgi:hypothetical protein
MTATELTTDDMAYAWACDEAYHLARLKGKVSILFDMLKGSFLSRDAEEALYDLKATVDEDNARTTNVNPDAGYPSGPDEEF